MQSSDLPHNLNVCQRRILSTIARLEKQRNNLITFDGIIKSQLENWYIEVVPKEEIYHPAAHYVPLFGILRDSQTTPLRIVYDCFYKSSTGVSLNDCLEVGPPF